MKKYISSKTVIAVLCFFILIASLSLSVKALLPPVIGDIMGTVEKYCRDYCKKYTNDQEELACLHGCLVNVSL